MNNKFGKKDIIFYIILILTGLILTVTVFAFSKTGDQILISVNGKSYGVYQLDQNQTIPILIHGKVTNQVTIRDKKAWMTKADCPDHLCMKQGKISKNGESIVCLPNKIVVEVQSSKKAEYDSISR